MHKTALLMGVILAGCDTGAGADSFRAALPDGRVRIDMPAAEAGGADRSAVGDRSEYAGLTGQVTTDVNGFIGSVLDTVDTITSFDPTWTDGDQTALWGPWEDNGTVYALWVSHDPAEGLYTWGISMRGAEEAEDDAVTTVAGQANDDATADTYAGWFIIDFDAISEKDPSSSATGVFASSYDVDGDVVVATAAFEDFSEGAETVTAVYEYEQTVGVDGLMDLIYAEDITGNGEEEINIIRSRWIAEGQGRADAYVTGGELGELVFSATECWDDGYWVTFYEDNYSMERNGEESSCVFEEPSFNEE